MYNPFLSFWADNIMQNQKLPTLRHFNPLIVALTLDYNLNKKIIHLLE